MIIPFDALSPEALEGLISEFVTREGTDYGAIEASLARKIADVLRQLKSGEAVIVYNQATQSTDVVPRRWLVHGDGDGRP
ncbi:MAG: YheU family protein [Betaproteobacteria bacterium]|nr:YheU family protein [Betaproteobacteria bacterium]